MQTATRSYSEKSHGPHQYLRIRAIAQAKLTPMAYDYYASGARERITLREPRAAYDRLRLRYRVLRDISRRSTATTVLGHALNMPVIVAPPSTSWPNPRGRSPPCAPRRGATADRFSAPFRPSAHRGRAGRGHRAGVVPALRL